MTDTKRIRVESTEKVFSQRCLGEAAPCKGIAECYVNALISVYDNSQRGRKEVKKRYETSSCIRSCGSVCDEPVRRALLGSISRYWGSPTGGCLLPSSYACRCERSYCVCPCCGSRPSGLHNCGRASANRSCPSTCVLLGSAGMLMGSRR